LREEEEEEEEEDGVADHQCDDSVAIHALN